MLGFVVTSYIFQVHERLLEGDMTRLRSSIVNNRTLANICTQHLKMDSIILMNKQHDDSTTVAVHGRETILAGAVEALIGAVYMDKGIDVAADFVCDHVLEVALRSSLQELLQHDPVSLLLIKASQHPTIEPISFVKEKPATMIVKVGDRVVAKERGLSFKTAKRAAAEKAIDILKEEFQP